MAPPLKLLILSILLSCLASQSWGGFVARDLLMPGDGLLTYDDINQREWLDLDFTLGSGREGLLAALDDGGLLEGFQFATADDVRQLADSAGVYWYGPPSNGLDAMDQTHLQLLGLLGMTLRLDTDVAGLLRFSGGLVVEVGNETPVRFDPGLLMLVVYGDDLPPGGNFHGLLKPTGGFDFFAPSQFAAIGIDLTTSYWLYREASAAPEPTGLWGVLLAASASIVGPSGGRPLARRA